MRIKELANIYGGCIALIKHAWWTRTMTYKKRGPDTIIGHPKKDGSVLYLNTWMNRLKNLEWC